MGGGGGEGGWREGEGRADDARLFNPNLCRF